MDKSTTICVQLIDTKGQSLSLDHVSVDLVFYLDGRERYRFDIGETDERGRICVSYDQIEEIRKSNKEFALMDYNTRLDECDKVVRALAPTFDQLRARLSALQKWFPDSAPGLRRRLESSNNIGVSASGVEAALLPGETMTIVELPIQT